ncbi:MAG: hypothetical protein ACXVX8_02695 [Blastococcus sp.]
MSWTFRVVEQPDGRWHCRFGLTRFDVHDTLADAVEHMSERAAAVAPASVIAHAAHALPQVQVVFL